MVKSVKINLQTDQSKRENSRIPIDSRFLDLITSNSHPLYFIPHLTIMDAFSNLPESQKGDFMRHLEDQQMKDSLK